MARNGSGTYNLPSGQPVVTGTTISSTVFNALTADLANALTTSVATDGQTAMAANLPMGSHKLTGLAAGAGAGESLRYEQLFSQGVEAVLSSAATTDIGAQNTNFLQVTGTTTITSFGTNYNGPRFIRFAGALTLTHNATTLVLPGAANIVTAAGDSCVAMPIGSPGSGWQVVSYQRAAAPLGIVSGASVATTSGTSVDITSIPSWAKRITVQLTAVSTSGTSNPQLQIGTSGGVSASGYLGCTAQLTNAAAVGTQAFTAGIGLATSVAAALAYHGTVVLSLLDASTNTWAAQVNVGITGGTASASSGGYSKALTGPLDRIRLTTVGGTDTFDAGSMNILYE